MAFRFAGYGGTYGSLYHLTLIWRHRRRWRNWLKICLIELVHALSIANRRQGMSIRNGHFTL